MKSHLPLASDFFVDTIKGLTGFFPPAVCQNKLCHCERSADNRPEGAH